tara:strand:- start:182 stop:3388 length:3207 start_codon:yes stop_codon:yes gene_type:complete
MAYGKYRHSTIYGEKGSIWNVEIWKDNFSGSSSEIDLAGEGFTITWNGQGGTRDRVFLGSECKLNCVVKDGTDESFLYDTLSSGYKEYFVRIYRGTVSDSNLWWYGWVQPAFDAIENAPFPYVFQLTSTDSYGFFNKQKDKTFTGEVEKTAPHKLKDIFRDTLLTEMNIFDSAANESPAPQNFYVLRTSLDWRQVADSYTSDPADLYYIAKGNVISETDFDPETGATILDNKPFDYKSQDVFNGLLKAFNAVGYLAEGKYNIIQPNSLKGNTTGVLRTWEYSKTAETSLVNLDTLLTINQSTNVVLAGSTLNYEPSFESVKVNYKKGLSIFNVGFGQDISSLVYAGTLVQNTDAQLYLSFWAIHEETINTSDIGVVDIEDWTFRTEAVLTIKATSGSSTRYLVQDSNGQLVWQSASATITIQRGYNIDQDNPINQLGGFSSGTPYNLIGTEYGPCSESLTNSGAQQNFVTQIRFETYIPFPDITPVDVEVQLDADNKYYRWNSSSSSITELPMPQPSPTSASTTCEYIQLLSILTEGTNSPGLSYTASFDGNNSVESFDLGDVSLGQSATDNKMYTIQYLDGSTYKSIANFQRGNPTPDDPTNVSFLLAREFFDLQTQPLEILQADIQSSDISPLKLIKYSIDGDTNYKYYTFLGGTFKAQSEILSGEWFKVSTANDTVTGGIPLGDTFVDLTPRPQKNVIDTSISNERAMLDNNSYGKISSALPSNTADTKVTLDANSKGKIYSGQKLVLTYPDKSNPLILTASGDTTTSSSVVNLASFTPNIIYPVGSIISPLLYDFTNVITGGGGSTSPGGSDTQVQFNDSSAFGGDSGLTYNKTTDTLTAVNLDVQDIDVTGSSNALTVNCDIGNVGIYVISTDNVASIRFEDNGTNDVILAGADGDDFIIRTDDGGFKVKTQENATTALEVTATGNLKTHNIGNIFDTEAYLTAVDFCMSTDRSKSAHSRSNGAASRIDSSIASTFATFQVPLGYQVTHVLVSGSSTSSTFDVYESDCDSSSATSLTSSPAVGTNTALSSASTGGAGKYLVIKFTPGATTRDVYGAKITLARV